VVEVRFDESRLDASVCSAKRNLQFNDLARKTLGMEIFGRHVVTFYFECRAPPLFAKGCGAGSWVVRCMSMQQEEANIFELGQVCHFDFGRGSWSGLKRDY